MKGFYTLRVKKIQRETAESVSIEFDVPEDLREEFSYAQGQHLTLRLEHEGEDVRRTYSLHTAPHEKRWAIGVKKVPDGIFSTYANEQLKVGDLVESMPPRGNFHSSLDPKNKKKYLAIVAGSGITPVLSMIKEILRVEPRSEFSLYYGNKSRHTVMFREELEEIKNKYMQRFSFYHIFTQEENESGLFNGRISAEKVQKLLHIFHANALPDEVFLCGPKEMIFSAKEVCEKNGIAESSIHFELFFSGDSAMAEKIERDKEGKGRLSRVDLIIDGREMRFDLDSKGKSILQTALDKGADLPFACKGGVCATCKAKLEEGEVRMDVNYALEKDELEKGYILTCQSHPKSKSVLVNFDV